MNPTAYDDGLTLPVNPTVERAFRRGFAEGAEHVVGEWVDPDDRAFDPYGDIATAERNRQRVRQRFAARPGGAVAAARARGAHHAMAFVVASWDDVADIDEFDRYALPAWLAAVEKWERSSMGLIVAPPHPLDFVRAVSAETVSQPAASVSALPSTPPEPATARRLRAIRANAIEVCRPDWLIRGMLERDSIALVFGESGCGKTFHVLDWSLRIATGTAWRGHPVKRAPIAYVCGEGLRGIGKRLMAWSEHHDVSLDDAMFHVIPAVAIPDPAGLVSLLECIEADVVATDGKPAMVVIDTVARAFGGADENSTQDMSRFVAACDVIRRSYDGCTVLLAHHVGLGDKSRARGASALKAALDCEFRLSNDAGLMLTCTKSKDGEPPDPLSMELVQVELPLVDDFGRAVTSCAIDVLDADISALTAKAKAGTATYGKWQRTGLTVARQLVPRPG